MNIALKFHAMKIKTFDAARPERRSFSAVWEIGPHSFGLSWWPRDKTGLTVHWTSTYLDRRHTRKDAHDVVQVKRTRALMASAT